MATWALVDSITRCKTDIPDGYELRAVDDRGLHWIVTYRTQPSQWGSYLERKYKVTDASAVLVSAEIGFGVRREQAESATD